MDGAAVCGGPRPNGFQIFRRDMRHLTSHQPLASLHTHQVPRAHWHRAFRLCLPTVARARYPGSSSDSIQLRRDCTGSTTASLPGPLPRPAQVEADEVQHHDEASRGKERRTKPLQSVPPAHFVMAVLGNCFNDRSRQRRASMSRAQRARATTNSGDPR